MTSEQAAGAAAAGEDWLRGSTALVRSSRLATGCAEDAVLAGRSARAVAVEATPAAVLGGGDWCRHAVWAALWGRGGIK